MQQYFILWLPLLLLFHLHRCLLLFLLLFLCCCKSCLFFFYIVSSGTRPVPHSLFSLCPIYMGVTRTSRTVHCEKLGKIRARGERPDQEIDNGEIFYLSHSTVTVPLSQSAPPVESLERMRLQHAFVKGNVCARAMFHVAQGASVLHGHKEVPIFHRDKILEIESPVQCPQQLVNVRTEDCPDWSLSIHATFDSFPGCLRSGSGLLFQFFLLLLSIAKQTFSLSFSLPPSVFLSGPFWIGSNNRVSVTD